MLGVVVLSLGSVLLLLVLLILLLSLVFCYCKICKRTKPSSRRDVERGLENGREDATVPEDGLTSTSSLYRRITEPEIKNGKLYGQDYFAIKERLNRTQSLFVDDKVETGSGLAIQRSELSTSYSVPRGQVFHQLQWEDKRQEC